MSVLVQFRAPDDETTYTFGPYTEAHISCQSLWVIPLLDAVRRLAIYDAATDTWQVEEGSVSSKRFYVVNFISVGMPPTARSRP